MDAPAPENPRTAAAWTAVAWTGISALALLACASAGADPGLLFCGGILTAGAWAKAAGLRPWAGLPRVGWTQSLALACVLLGGWLTAWLAQGQLAAAVAAQASGLLFCAGLCAAALAAPAAGPPPGTRDPGSVGRWALALLTPAGFYLCVLLLRHWVLAGFGSNLGYSLFLFYMGRTGYEGIPSGPFAAGPALAWPALWWAASLACAAWAWRSPGPRRLWTLALAAFAAKPALAALSGSGLQVLQQKVQAVSTAYYALAALMDRTGVWRFVCGFNALQPGLGTHGVSHPFGPELFYWLLARGIATSPWVPALAIAALTSLAPLLLCLLALELGAPPRAGLAAALLYLASPASGILSTSGIDSVLGLAFLATAWLALRAVLRRDAAAAWLAGTLLFAASLLSLATAYLVLALGLAAGLHAARTTPGGRRDLLAAALRMAGAALLGHLLLWAATAGAFSYLQVFRTAAPYQYFGTARPLFLWAWLNPLLYLGFAGAGTLALAAAAAAAWLLEGRRPPLAALVPLSLLAAAWLMGLGLGECQRVFHWGYPALCLLALSSPLARWEGRRGLAALALLATLNALTSAALMAAVMDYW